MDKAMELASLIAANDPRMVQGVKDLLIRDIGDEWRSHYQNELDARQGSSRRLRCWKASSHSWTEREGTEDMTQLDSPLEGLRLLDLGRYQAGPAAP